MQTAHRNTILMSPELIPFSLLDRLKWVPAPSSVPRRAYSQPGNRSFRVYRPQCPGLMPLQTQTPAVDREYRIAQLVYQGVFSALLILIALQAASRSVRLLKVSHHIGASPA